MRKIGLIAGNGNFPLLFAEAAKKAGCLVVAAAIREEADPKIEGLAQSTYWIGAGELKTLIEIFQKEKVTQAVMAGQIRHKLLFSDIEMDDELKNLFLQLKDKKTDTILGAVCQRLGQLGINFIDSSTFLKEYLVPSGVLTQKTPTTAQYNDINFGFEIAKVVAGLDIGQTVVVKDRVVLSVEAIEGTDEAIRRANIYCQGQAVVVKVSKPNQDMRFDIPFIGKNTIDTLARERAAVLAVEAGKTILIDREYVLGQADRNGIVIIAL